MPHDLFGERFVSHREPAWHSLGLVVEEPVSAAAAFQQMGPYDVFLADLKVEGVTVEIGQRAIVRSPVPDDPEHRVFGMVGPDYGLISPEQFCSIWDEHVGQPVETIGVLGKGETMFISTKMPAFGVRGDEVDNYLLGVSPMTGASAAEARVTPVRVVCRNTLVLSEIMASEVYRIVHDATARERMATWLSDLYNRALERTEALREAFNVLAGHHMTRYGVDKVLALAYPMPKAIREDAPETVLARRAEFNNYLVDSHTAQRKAVRELFAGAGTGMDHTACAGTAWGLYNAVVEYEDYRRGRGVVSVAREALFGYRAKIKARVFDACLEQARN